MDNLLFYLLKVSAGTMLFYLCYILFFNKDTFYHRNRVYLIGLTLLSVIIPLLKIYNISTDASVMEHVNPMTSIILSGSVFGAAVSEKVGSVNVYNLFIWLYFSVSLFFLFRALISVARTFMIIRKGKLQDTKFPRIVISDLEQPPFSFFPYIVIPKKTIESSDYRDVLEHEKVHVRQGHTFDLLFSELLIVFLWFNPFIWLIKRSMVLNHEYLADNFLIKSALNVKEYQYRLLNIPNCLKKVPLAHNFSSLIKNRIIMINKKPTPKYAALKSIIIFPVAAILFVMFSFRPESDQANTINQKPLFSKSSQTEILVFLAQNTGYPQEARNSSDTGKIYVVIKMNKGGLIKECKAFTERKGINVPFIEEVVIVGNKPSAGTGAAGNEKTTGNEHTLLKTECLRVANKLNEVKIPEWQDKDMEFAVTLKFILK